MGLTSIDYAQLIQNAALHFHNVVLNRTQINKILFYVYGKYLAVTDKKLFVDDTPKAWPYGPVFPIVNKRIALDDIPRGFSSEKNTLFREKPEAISIVKEAVDRFYNWSAYDLTKWSHAVDSPWYQTKYPASGEKAKWNTEIDDELIKKYFKENYGGN
ncbi:MAG: SocA family protein [Bacteroides sp.]|nr:SocA family protein [Bacteroides sp.]